MNLKSSRKKLSKSTVSVKRPKVATELTFPSSWLSVIVKVAVGVGLGKSPSVLSSIEKGIRRAKKRMIQVPIKNGTIPFPITIKKGAARLLLKPAPEGTGIIAGGASEQ